MLERIIGKFDGKQKGPLIFCFGGIHGNELAGVEALENVLSSISLEPKLNPDFTFRGRLLAIHGNLQAIEQRQRFIQKDLNRQWTADIIDALRRTDPSKLEAEHKELLELITLIESEIKDYQPEVIAFLDLHTTTAQGGIFSVPANDPESLQLAVDLHAPVIKGMMKGVKGTLLHYVTEVVDLGAKVLGVAFEAGQHNDVLSVNRSIAAIINCLKTLGCVDPDQVRNRFDQLLKEYSEGLPKVAELTYRHAVAPEDEFEMLPGFFNFQPVVEGQPLAKYKFGWIESPHSGLILMPLYQPQGEDGFFIVKPVKNPVPQE